MMGKEYCWECVSLHKAFPLRRDVRVDKYCRIAVGLGLYLVK